ncbi:MAG: hypothetical protein CME62_15765 [Halobacteriovoraceae bacterium]|nr:hypothetical protein [Halobacteriovoraceae bacterium]|tara:strand:- start:5757 stop:6476 length:720 start_codon:yes stop_codon:yes gene_type:complete
MNKESFKILKEINSLYTSKDRTQHSIDSEYQRIAKIEKQSTLNKEELTREEALLSEFRQKLTHAENEVDKLQALIEKSQAHLNQVFTTEEIKALESQIDQATIQLHPLEEKTLELMQEIEDHEKRKEEIKEFLKGCQETIKEIQIEVDDAVIPLNKEIQSFQARIDLLISELPENVVSKLNQLREKKLTHGPLAEIAEKKCSICSFHLDQSLIAEVEKNLKFKTCSGCGRILVPGNALY